jgi:hypothetical protein
VIFSFRLLNISLAADVVFLFSYHFNSFMYSRLVSCRGALILAASLAVVRCVLLELYMIIGLHVFAGTGSIHDKKSMMIG